MKMPIKILIKCFVKPFYRQHAGLFVFLFIILFGAVGRVDGAGLFDYHFSLIRGALKNSYLFLLILFLWLLYAKKCEQFILNVLRKPEYSFLQMFSLLRSKTLFIMLALVQVLLYLPIIAYAVIMGIAGIYLHTYITCGVLISYMFTICFLSARWYLYNIKNPGLPFETRIGVVNLNLRETSYWKLFIRHISRNKKLLFIGMKIFSCGILSGMLMNQTGREYELKMIILFFSLAILGHGLLIHQIRDLEETRLSFYRSIPVSLFKRYVQYAAFYLIILLPEIFTILLFTPKYLNYTDAVLLIFFSYSLLLFMHSLLFIQLFPMKIYLKLILCLYLIIYISILISCFFWLCVFLFLSSMVIFRDRYYQYERPAIG